MDVIIIDMTMSPLCFAFYYCLFCISLTLLHPLSYFRLAGMVSNSQDNIISQPGQEGGMLYTNDDRLEEEWDDMVGLEGRGAATMMPRVDPPRVVGLKWMKLRKWI